MASDIPPYLEVGTPVSAKFKGAFCEATIKSIKKHVKCKVWCKDIQSSAVLYDDAIVGDLKLNAQVVIKHGERANHSATIVKMNDFSLYTVIFDDGDERTLRRTNICIMGERHFQEDETLDNLPLTDPENFGTPVLTSGEKRRKRRRMGSQARYDEDSKSVDEEDSDSDGPSSSKKWSYIDKEYLGKVIVVEQGERKKTWFPALGLRDAPEGGEPDNNQVAVQSFKDGKKMHVNREDVKPFDKETEPLLSYLKGDTKIEPILRNAIEKALAYFDYGELPKGWNILDTIDENHTSDDDSVSMPVLNAESKTFTDKVYEFHEKQGNTLSRPAVINNQDVDLHRLYQMVVDSGGMDEVSNQEWRNIYLQLGLQNIPATASLHLKNLYKKYLLPYEEYCKTTLSETPNLERAKQATKRSSSSRDDMAKSPAISESDSESDRRSTKRSTRSSGVNEKLIALDGSEKKRSKASSSDHSGNDDGADESTCSSKDFFQEHDFEMKLSEEDVDVVNSPISSITSEDNLDVRSSGKVHDSKYKPGTRIVVKYGKGKNQREYDAKILEVDRDESTGDVVYFIHYNGWNTRYDEWIKDERIGGLGTPTPKRRNAAPPTPLSKIAKDPPAAYKSKLEAANSALQKSKLSKSPQHCIDKATLPLPALKVAPPPPKLKESPGNPPLAPKISPPLLVPDALFSPDLAKLKHQHRVKPITDALFIPDIKPSPVKPRLTRNSMQDTFLLNALEESIGKQTKMALSSPVDSSSKSDCIPPFMQPSLQHPPLPSQFQNRRRSIRTQNQSPKHEGGHSDVSSKGEDKDSDELESSKKDGEKNESTSSNNDSDTVSNEVAVKIEPLEHKESSKEASVKKWIEDSSKLLCKTSQRRSRSDLLKTTGADGKTSEDSDAKNRRGRKPKSRASTKTYRGRKQRSVNNNDSDNNSEDDDDGDKKDDEDDDGERSANNVICGSLCSDSNTADASLLERERTSETAQTLSDFCNIVDSVQKLSSENIEQQSYVDNSKSPFGGDSSGGKPPHKKKKRRRRNTQSSCQGDQDPLKSPSRKEKRTPPMLEYKVDFISDLPELLKEKDPMDRIVIMQSRLNGMRKLYSKLRCEVASIDRRKRRKLQKQLEAELNRREVAVDVR